MKNFDVAIIGGGASGLACAATLIDKSDLKIAVIDAADRLGKKLAATGNGQGNISNTDMDLSHYHGSAKSLAADIACPDPFKATELFDCLFSVEKNGRIYPTGKQASALTDILLSKLTGKAEILTSHKVIDIDDDFNIYFEDKSVVKAKYIVLCVGGKAQKQFKTDGFSYNLCKKFGHSVTPLYPSIVQLKTDTENIKRLKGIRADCNVSAYLNGKKVSSFRGDVIFTEYGVSGNAVFYLSSVFAGKDNGKISIEFLPDVTKAELKKNIEKRKNCKCGCLSGTLHNKIGQAIVLRAEKEEADICDIVKDFTLNVVDTLGFDYAQVTRGGVPFNEITNELESVFKKRLYFAGEIIDIDGDCGGYNLHWAFTSGMRVAENVLKDYERNL